MFGFFDKKSDSRKLYAVEFIIGCCVDEKGNYHFQGDYKSTKLVYAKDIMDAGVVFANHNVLTPHVCICNIREVKTIN